MLAPKFGQEAAGAGVLLVFDLTDVVGMLAGQHLGERLLQRVGIGAQPLDQIPSGLLV